MLNLALLLVAITTLTGSHTAFKVRSRLASSAFSQRLNHVPIIGEAYFEDLQGQNPVVTPEMLRKLNKTNAAPRHLQAALPSNRHQLEMLNAVNRERAIVGLYPLCMNTKLQNVALGHSIDMAVKNYMSHIGSDGSTVQQRIQTARYDSIAAGENVAAGNLTVAQVMKAWMNSTNHRANILRQKITMFGCGYAYNQKSTYKYYWTQNFGASRMEKCS
ncbi:uncharacterized protein CCR75_000230 [Bremia lactucae]|uniref:SCP domain-containing protein n=1 Tax=Bremia lactucae TaxID=4779 RepID=A0A976IAZ5_BRELC|nr:hypothetical protein CCR75_000230 [Bremia lactucae]